MTNNAKRSGGPKECLLCHRPFFPNPKVKNQDVCSLYECQQLRQKLNRLDYSERNPVDYKQWYQDYGIPYQQKHPNYQRDNRRKKVMAENKKKNKVKKNKHMLIPLLRDYQAKKKEALILSESINNNQCSTEKKEELTYCYYVIKAKEFLIIPLNSEKKESLTSNL